MTQRQIAEDAFFIQRQILNLPIGKQDEYAAAYGGLNFIEFSEKEVSVNPIQIDPDTKKSLEKNLLLFFTKKTRQASTILQRQEDSIKGKDTSIIEAMIEVKNNAYHIKEALEVGDLKRFGSLLDQAWNSKKKMSPEISNDYLDRIYEIASQNGALGGKIAGAGGGGYFMFYCEEEKQENLKNAMASEKLAFLDFNFSDKGVTILNNGNAV